MPQVGPLEILVIFVVALVVFGPKEIPKIARQAAKAWREIQRFQANLRRDIDEVLREDDDEERGTTPPPTLPPKPPVKQPGLEPGSRPPSDATPPADATS
jgi:Tat protein translocase TatB subunit